MYTQKYYTQKWQLNSSKTTTGAAKALLVANCLAFLFMLAFNYSAAPAVGLSAESIWGLNPEKLLGKFWLWQYVTHPFVHTGDLEGVLGVVFSCLILWWLGRELEAAFSPRRFIYFYFVCAAATGVAGGLYLRGTPSMGSSACMMALLGAYGVMYPDRPVLGKLQVKHLLVVIVSFFILSSLGSDEDKLLLLYNMSGLLAGVLMVGVFAISDRYQRAFSELRMKRRELELSQIDVRVDDILGKISRTGIGSLTRDERKFLSRASRCYRDYKSKSVQPNDDLKEV